VFTQTGALFQFALIVYATDLEKEMNKYSDSPFHVSLLALQDSLTTLNLTDRMRERSQTNKFCIGAWSNSMHNEFQHNKRRPLMHGDACSF
jgi:hypothetical protein